MKKQCVIFIHVDNEMLPLGTVEIEKEYDYDSIMQKDELVKVILKRIDINVKREDILWEKK